MADEEIKSNLDAPLYGARIASPLCKNCIHFDGFDDDFRKKKAYRCKKYGDTPKEYYGEECHRCPHFKPNEWFSRSHGMEYDPNTWAEFIDKKVREEEEYWSTPPWERGILKSK